MGLKQKNAVLESNNPNAFLKLGVRPFLLNILLIFNLIAKNHCNRVIVTGDGNIFEMNIKHALLTNILFKSDLNNAFCEERAPYGCEGLKKKSFQYKKIKKKYVHYTVLCSESKI